MRDGISNQIINDVLEDKQGRFWIAGNGGGITLFIDTKESADDTDRQSKKFVVFTVDDKNKNANQISRILIDSKDNLWCLTAAGVYRAVVSDSPKFSLVYKKPGIEMYSKALFEDFQGNIWFGAYSELFEIRGDEIINHGAVNGDQDDFLSSGLQAKDGRIIILSRTNGLFEFVPQNSTWKKLPGSSGKFSNFRSIWEDSENSLWFGGRNVLSKQTGDNLVEYSTEQGVLFDNNISLFQDREGNLWGGRGILGIYKLPPNPIVSYPFTTERYSLGVSENKGIFTSHFCERNNNQRFTLYFCTAKKEVLNDTQNKIVEETDGILPFARNFLIYKEGELWGIQYDSIRASILNNSIFQLPEGGWIDVKEFFNTPFKQNDDTLFHLDEKNVLWIGKSDGTICRVSFTENGKKQIEEFRWNNLARPRLMINDRQERLWIFFGDSHGGRLRNGKYEEFPPNANIPKAPISIFLDSRGWIWVGTENEGVFVCKNPLDENPVFDLYTTETENRLLSSTVHSFAEDNEGQMYIGTSNGLNNFNPKTGIWHSFTTNSGLPINYVSGLLKDSEGNIWINTQSGLAKFNPKSERKSVEPPPTYITGVKIAGQEYPFDETGITAAAAPVELDYSQNNLTIDYVGLQFKNEDSLTYQYKLENTGEDWSKPNKNRTITLANLDSGNYSFLIRAINEDGLISTQPAAFQFKIYPPIYLRLWFLALATLLVGAIIYAFYRVRLQKLLEVERARTLIATDLHDDIGSNLSKIAILSEVVRMQTAANGNDVDDKLLGSIAEISRESVVSMRDIVWAINPERDSAQETARKMIEFAEEIFVPKNVRVEFIAPEDAAKIKLSMNLRRDLYLIYKEAINNIVKHSNPGCVKIEFYVKNREIVLIVEDDGDSFDLREEASGNGLFLFGH